jgi:UDP-N-acetylglucosamine 2-epimerase (non-hydrolysing)
MKNNKIILVAGARPNFMKIAPLVKAIEKFNHLPGKKRKSEIHYLLVHTGQHYDEDMSEFFFRDLDLPKPDIYLGVGSATHAEQTAKIMVAFERVCLREKPCLIVVVGDVNSTLACGLVAAKLGIPVAHVEAGLRSFDRSMPEEINRVLTDHLSDYLFTTCEDANKNLVNEGIAKGKIYLVGNVMVDTLCANIEFARRSNILNDLSLRKDGKLRKYALLTLHRPSNVDDYNILRNILLALNLIARKIPVIFPVHPRTINQIRKFGLSDLIANLNLKIQPIVKKIPKRILALPPLGYLDFLSLMSNAAIVLTDSGGIQEETTILGIPCFTLRDNTERPITIKQGTNTLVGNNPDRIKKAIQRIKKRSQRRVRPKYWDGKAAQRIVRILTNDL